MIFKKIKPLLCIQKGFFEQDTSLNPAGYQTLYQVLQQMSNRITLIGQFFECDVDVFLAKVINL